MITRRAMLGLMAGSIAIPARLHAQTYPTKVIRIINPYPPGGTGDILARIIATGLTASWGQPVIVEAKPGASGNIGLEATARSTPDGYTLAVVPSSMTVATSLYKSLTFNPMKDLTPIGLIGKMPAVLATGPQSAFGSLDDVVQYARQHPGKLNYASFGIGTSPHLIMEHFLSKAGLSMTHIPYKGVAPSLVDLMGGQVELSFQTATAVVAPIQQGKLRALAVSTSSRFRPLPNVPTVTEKGFGEFDDTVWFGIVAPTGTPGDIIEKLNAEMTRVLRTAEVRKQLDELGVTSEPQSVADFERFVRSEEAKWTAVARNAGIKPE